MEEVFDACERAGETYLAFRLPREGADGGVVAEGEGEKVGVGIGTPGVEEGRVESEREKRRRGGGGKRKSVVGV